MGRTLPLRAAVAMAALLVSACGTPRLTHQQYQRQLTSIGRTTSATIQRIFSPQSLQDPDSLRQSAQAVRQGAGALRRAAAQLDGLAAPSDAADANDKLVKALRDFAGELETFADDALAGNVAEVRRFDRLAASNSLPAERELAQVARELEAAGYRTKG